MKVETISNYEVVIKLNSMQEVYEAIQKLKLEGYDASVNNCYELTTVKEE